MTTQRIIQHIKSNRCYLRQGAKIVFVCGRDIKNKDSKRKIFIDYASKHIQDAHFLLAEDVIRVSAREHGDMLSIEANLGKYSDCIVIILESESAFTELGAFAIDEELCRLIIPINDENFKDQPSFINLGPLRKISKVNTGLGPTIHTNMETFSDCFPEIQKRLKKIIPSCRKNLKVDNLELFQCSNKERILLVHDIIKILAPVKFTEIISIFKEIYGKDVRFDMVSFDIKLLEALRLIAKADGYYISEDSKNHFIDFGRDSYTSLKTKQLMLYKRHHPERLSLLGRVAYDAATT